MSDSTHPNDTHGTKPQLPECLHSDGTNETALNQNRPKAISRESAVRLCDQLLRDVNSLRRKWGEAIFEIPNEDPVLRLCVAAQSAGSISDEHLSQAQYRYEQDLADYDLVLGELIPRNFRDAVRARLAQEAYRENTNPTAAEDWDVFRMTQQVGHDGLLGLTTGLPRLDSMLGGLRGLAFIAGGKGVGKTSLVLSMVLAALEADSNCAALVYSLDMPKSRIYARLLSHASGVDFRTLQAREKSPEVARQIAQADQHLRQNILPRLRVIERDFSCERLQQDDGSQTLAQKGLTVQSVITDCRQLMGACGATQLLLVFDLFQKMDPHGSISEGAATDHYRLDMLNRIQAESANPGRPYGFPIVVISEVRKEARKTLCRDDLKGDGRMAGDADVVMLLWPGEKAGSAAKDEDIVPITLRIDKGREGVQRGDLQLWFEHQCFRFHDTKPSANGSNFVPGNKMFPPAADAPSNPDPLAE